MASRAIGSAAIAVLIGWMAATPAPAQNLEAGKAPSQIFAGTCTACHKSARGLLKTVAPGSLQSFLRQHYTTGSDMASQLTTYLVSNGASDPRGNAGLTKQGQEAKSGVVPAPASNPETKGGRRQDQRDASKPDADGLSADAPPPRAERKRLARPTEDIAPDGQSPTGEGKAGRQKAGKKGRPGRDAPPAAVEPADAPKTEPAPADTAKVDPQKSAPDADQKSPAAASGAPGDAARPDGSVASVPLRHDPVPAVTPASKSGEGDAQREQATSQTASHAAPSEAKSSEPSRDAPSMPEAPPAVAVAPAGTPAPPISQ